MSARRRGLAAVLVVGAMMALGGAVPGVASASPFVEGESLEWCGTGGGGVALSGDGKTAISGECVFVLEGGVWVKQAVLPLPFKQPNVNTHGVSYSISSDGNTVIADGEFATNEERPVFVRKGGIWTQQGSFTGGFPNLSGDGNTVAIDGPWENEHSVVDVFVRSGETWVQQATLTRTAVQKGKKGHDEAIDFGADGLSADGNTLLTDDSAANKGKGEDLIYVRSGETWTLAATIAPSHVKGKEAFGGGALSADGSTLVVGEGGETKKGGVYFFKRSGETWTQQGPVISPTGKVLNFGQDVAISGDGDTALVLSGNRHRGRPETIWVYERSGEAWSNTQQLLPPGNPVLGSYIFAEEGIQLSEDGNTVMTDYEIDSVSHQTLSWTR